MARQVLPIVGAVVGAYFGNPQLGYAIGAMIGNAVDPQVIKGPQLGEGQDNTASEGGYRPIVLGKGAVGVCMLHEGPIIKRTIRHRQSKGGGPVTEEERAYRTMAFGLGESADPTTGVALTRLWIDNVLRYDVTPASQIVAESTEFAEEFTFYPGNLTQQPDPDIEAFMGVGNVPAYPGSPYIVFPHYDVTDSRGRAPVIKAELVTEPAGGSVVLAARKRGNLADTMTFTPDWAASGWTQIDPNWASDYGVSLTRVRSGRILLVSGAAPALFTDDWGASWTESAGGLGSFSHRPTVAGALIGTVSPNTGIRYSADYGTSFTNPGGTPNGNVVLTVNIAGVHRNIIYNHSFTRAWSSDGNFTSWGGHVDVYAQVGSLGSSVHGAWSSGSAALFGGAESGVGPKIIGTLNGSDWFNQALPTLSGTAITCITEHDGIWVAGTDAGEIIYRDQFGVWRLADDSLGVPARDVTHNGAVFLMIGSGDSTGAIKSSADGKAWTTRFTGPATPTTPWWSIAPINVPTTGGPVLLSHVVQWCHERVGAGGYNVSDLTDEVEGVVFGDGYTASDAIRTLMALYFFDAGEYDGGSGYRINYIKRGKPAVMTLTDDDIVDGPEDWEREDSYERPRVLHVAYQNPIADYGAPNIVIKRTSPDVKVVGERSISVPVVFSDVDEITQRSDILMTVMYTEIAGNYEIVLPGRLLALSPTDSIGFSIRGRTRRLRMVSWRYSPDGTIKTEWMSDRQSSYTSNVTGLPVTPTRPPPPSIVGPTISAALDIPALVDSLDGLHLVLAASGQTGAWYGSDHQRKLEAETDFTTVMRFNPPTTIMGVLQGTVTAASPHFTDTTNVVRVKLYSDDELVTHTQQQFLSEQGAFALAWDDGGTRRWELLQYRDAIKVGDSEWELTTLARGRLNTTASEHPSGSLFVLLDAGIRAVPMQSGWIGMDITHRAVSLGQSPESAVPYVEEYAGQSQVEFPVAHLFLQSDGDDINCLTVPRHRFGTDDAPMRSLNWEGYLWTATDGSNTASATTTTDTHTFDVTGWASPVTVTVAQVNRITGAGPTVSETINA